MIVITASAVKAIRLGRFQMGASFDGLVGRIRWLFIRLAVYEVIPEEVHHIPVAEYAYTFIPF